MTHVECPKTHQEEVAAIFPGVDTQGTYACMVTLLASTCNI